MSQLVYLILYLWHADVSHTYRGGTGGPALTIQQVPTIAACEQLGRAAKELADGLRPAPVAITIDSMNSPPAAYRCITIKSR